MALTTAQAFDRFMEIISPTETQQEEIANKRIKTAGYLSAAFPATSTMPLKRVILIGSAARGTMVRPVEDVDVMAEFINKDKIFETYRNNSGALLQRIAKGLDAKTSLASIGARGQAVRLFYTSGAVVDIAPVFKWSSNGYALPSGDGGWITTDPEAQATWYTERKQVVGQNLTNLVKLARRWNGVHSHRFKSYHLEVVVANSFATVGSNWRTAMNKFFEWAPGHIAVSDPAGHFDRLDDYLSKNDLAAILSRFSEALERSSRALDAESKGDHAEAKRLWRIELGDEFPVG
jgi:predicted nucleotidyltransferase